MFSDEFALHQDVAIQKVKRNVGEFLEKNTILSGSCLLWNTTCLQIKATYERFTKKFNPPRVVWMAENGPLLKNERLINLCSNEDCCNSIHWSKPERKEKGNMAETSLYIEREGLRLFNGDCFDVLPQLENESVHFICIDPPYFIDGMGSDWNRDNLNTKKGKAKVIGSLPVGMKFDPEQGRNFQKFMEPVAVESLRILKPGGFFISFSQCRLYHRLACAVEDAGFEIRDAIAWKYNGQAKAFSMDHFVKKMSKTDEEKEEILRSLSGRKTPQLRPEMELMVLAQKPREGTFVDNWLKHQVGLMDTSELLNGKFPSTVMEVPKPPKKEKGPGTEHLTVKPVDLIEHLIKLYTLPDQVVVDFFMGSGTAGVAAVRSGRQFIGVEKDPVYFGVSKQRILNEETQ